MRTEKVSSTAVREAIETLSNLTGEQRKDKYRDIIAD
jgi:hypothetical protein